MLRFFYTQVMCVCVCFSIGKVYREFFVVSLTIADLAMIMTLTTWNFLDFRVGENEKPLKQYLFAQRW